MENTLDIRSGKGYGDAETNRLFEGCLEQRESGGEFTFKRGDADKQAEWLCDELLRRFDKIKFTRLRPSKNGRKNPEITKTNQEEYRKLFHDRIKSMLQSKRNAENFKIKTNKKAGQANDLETVAAAGTNNGTEESQADKGDHSSESDAESESDFDTETESEMVEILNTIDSEKEEAAVAKALDDLEKTLKHDNEQCREAFLMGAHRVLVKTLKKKQWPQDDNICASAMKSLSHLSLEMELPRIIVKLEGLDAIVNAMKGFPKALGVQVAGLTVLLKLLDTTGSDETPQEIQDATARFLDELAGIAMVIEALESFPGNLELQRSGCALLAGLAGSKHFNYARVQTTAKALVAVTKATLRRSGDDDSIKESFKKLTDSFRRVE